MDPKVDSIDKTIFVGQKISKIVGLKQNVLYPPTSNYNTNIAVKSNDEGIVPNANPVNCVLVRCSLVNNDLTVLVMFYSHSMRHQVIFVRIFSYNKIILIRC